MPLGFVVTPVLQKKLVAQQIDILIHYVVACCFACCRFPPVSVRRVSSSSWVFKIFFDHFLNRFLYIKKVDVQSISFFVDEFLYAK